MSLIEALCALSLQSYVALSVLTESSELATSITNVHQEVFGYEDWHSKSSNLTGAENATVKLTQALSLLKMTLEEHDIWL